MQSLVLSQYIHCKTSVCLFGLIPGLVLIRLLKKAYIALMPARLDLPLLQGSQHRTALFLCV